MGAGTSNMRVQADRMSGADVIIAAGFAGRGTPTMALGLRLMRLRTEWDAVDKPQPVGEAIINELARGYKTEQEGPHRGLVRVERAPGVPSQGVPAGVEYVLPLVLANNEAQRVREVRMVELMGKLPTLPAVRNSLCLYMAGQGWQDPVHMVGKVLLWWLDQSCTECNGQKRRVIPGTARLSGRACGVCHGTGKQKIPYGGHGRRLLEYIDNARKAGREGLGVRFRKGKREAPRVQVGAGVCVEAGQRWRARDGGLWDVLSVDALGMLLARIAGGDGRARSYRPDGLLARTYTSGPAGADLVECVGAVPA